MTIGDQQNSERKESDPHHGSGGSDPWNFENFVLSVLVTLVLMFSLESLTVTPEVSFSFFQQHILSTGEVSYL